MNLNKFFLCHELLNNMAESAIKTKQKLPKEETIGCESGHCSDCKALEGSGHSLEDEFNKDKFLEIL